jgi:hypothetical protein
MTDVNDGPEWKAWSRDERFLEEFCPNGSLSVGSSLSRIQR